MVSTVICNDKTEIASAIKANLQMYLSLLGGESTEATNKAVNELAPYFTLTNLQGQRISLNSRTSHL
ncbi:hypothetical protein [uncultured Psychromonas sp.]|uniref:hypothetical protein n=1 Tax=uncultured Psychromonas sp. TaxID=173974 RepID=UPI002623F405|nr:hypothetical protein [uncultured Psychromonas sp.]